MKDTRDMSPQFEELSFRFQEDKPDSRGEQAAGRKIFKAQYVYIKKLHPPPLNIGDLEINFSLETVSPKKCFVYISCGFLGLKMILTKDFRGLQMIFNR